MKLPPLSVYGATALYFFKNQDAVFYRHYSCSLHNAPEGIKNIIFSVLTLFSPLRT